MTAGPVWAGIIVRDLDASKGWYHDVLPVRDVEEGHGWVAFNLRGGSCVELHAGDPDKPGLSFPSYGASAGPAVMPGFGVDDLTVATDGFEVMRVFPDWVVVGVRDGLRVVLTDRVSEPREGLAGFAFTTPDPVSLGTFLTHIGYDGPVSAGDRLEVVPLLASDRDGDLVDPEGNLLRLVAVGAST